MLGNTVTVGGVPGGGDAPKSFATRLGVAPRGSMSVVNAGGGHVELDYAKGIRWHQRRWVVWVVLAVAVAALFFGWRSARGPWERFRPRWAVWRDVRACMDDSPAATVVAFESDPARGRGLRGGRDYAAYLGGRAGRLTRYGYASTGRRLQRRGSPYLADPTLFMHARQAPGGPQRFVVVQGWMEFPGPLMNLHLSGQVWDVDVRFGEKPVEVARSAGPVLTDRPSEGSTTTLRVFAGQADAKDASHFTLEYEHGGRRGVIDGWLRAASGGGGDHVELKVRE
jgi:hypothetical protein